MFILCFDFGIKYIGVAIGQCLTFNVSPLFSITISKLNHSYSFMLSIVSFWKPDYILVGYPISNMYDNSYLLNKIDYFVFFLRINYYGKVFLINENLSTWYTRRSYFFNFKNFNNRLLSINAYTAVILLEQWLYDNYV